MADIQDVVDRLEDLIAVTIQGSNAVAGAAQTAAQNLRQTASATGQLTQKTQQQTLEAAKGAAAARGLVNGFKSLYSAVGGVVMSMTTVPVAVAGANQTFTAVQPILNLAETTLKAFVVAMEKGVEGFLKFAPSAGIFTSALSGLAQGAIDLAFGAMRFQLEQTQKLTNNLYSLNKAGLVFGASLDETRKAANAAGLSIETFSAIASRQAANLALLGGSSEGAAKTLTTAASRMDSGLRFIFGGIEGLNNELIETTALQASLGVTQSRNADELAKNTAPYLLNLKEISLLTGKSTEQIRNEMKQRAQSAAFQNAYAQAGANAQENLTNALAQLTPQARAYAEELFAAQAVGADITSKSNLMLQATAGPLTDKIRQLVALKDLPPEEFRRRQAALLQDIGQAGKDLQKQYGYELFLQSAGRGPELFQMLNKTISEVISDTNRLATAVADQANAAASLGKIQNEFTETVRGIDDSLQKLKTGLESIAIENLGSTKNIVELSLKGAEVLKDGLQILAGIINKVAGPGTPVSAPLTSAQTALANANPEGPGTAALASAETQTAERVAAAAQGPMSAYQAAERRAAQERQQQTLERIAESQERSAESLRRLVASQ